jgi:phytoene synthase|tara:strand:- start:662 stop:1654 length:993 start_codon:yes stop_codon:yes gene_type:complete
MKTKLGTKLSPLNTYKKQIDSSMAQNVYSSETYGNRTSPTNPDEIFRKGSTTYYYSTKLFPANIRKEVTQLYNFVRIADDYVDSVPQDLEGFLNFKEEYYNVLSGEKSDNLVITDFVKLSEKREFKAEWIEAFLYSMEMDTRKSTYENLDELDTYLYGSAEVIGLMMNKVMNIDNRANDSARYLGKAMQFINFIRDIDEDLDLKRTYFPVEDLNDFGLSGLTRGEARRKPEQFKAFIRSQIHLYFKWQKRAELGFEFIPTNMRIAVKTASDMYLWTAKEIYRNPFIVYDLKIKPNWTKVLLNGLKNTLRAYNPLRRNRLSSPIAKESTTL